MIPEVFGLVLVKRVLHGHTGEQTALSPRQKQISRMFMQY
ncbi:hypothetical protein Mal48_11260 [Thalassoglobus polymorphus]|uniref:Uncharacterized protein n=1 Tax=Thalassoglobus polymorphus TaxID=2527994 RepID=A0A517QJS1_9PLAN|nr:hypothetical protein Mal48_11260 [Thalassoglobus polymorphus]